MLDCSPASCPLNLSWFLGISVDFRLGFPGGIGAAVPAVPGAKRQHFPKIRVVALNDAKHIALRLAQVDVILEVDTGHPWLIWLWLGGCKCTDRH